MYKYEYVKVVCSRGLLKYRNNEPVHIKDYRAIIDEKAQNGWRFVGFVPTKQVGYGYTQEIDLVFEKEL